jgi:thioredoxin 1
MSVPWKIAVVVALAAGIVAVLAIRQRSNDAALPAPDASESQRALPRLVDVGAGTCVPCKMMMPVLAELREEYAGRLIVEYHDVSKDPNLVTQYNVRVIPVQIFYDPSGDELFRHEGFYSKDDILAKWRELGIELGDTQ